MVVGDNNNKLGEISSIKIGSDRFFNPKSVMPASIINQGFGISQKIKPDDFFNKMAGSYPQSNNIDPMAMYMMMQGGQASDKLRAGYTQPKVGNVDQFAGLDPMTMLALMQNEEGVNQMRSGVNPANFMQADFSNKGYSSVPSSAELMALLATMQKNPSVKGPTPFTGV